MKIFHKLTPITTKSEDTLGRADFATSLAVDLTNYSDRESIVVGLFGDWGDGKTSVKNMAIEHANTLDTPPLILDFNPWQWSETGAIKDEFFRELCKLLGLQFGDPIYAKAADLLEKYSKSIRGLSYLAEFSGVLTDALHLPAAAPITKSVIKRLIERIVGPSDVSQTIAQLRDKNTDTRGAKELKNLIDSEFEKAGRNLIIFIDDIDRLSPEEVLSMLQFVKSTVNFPRTVYVLLTQRDYIIKAIAQRYEKEYAVQYLEKIIQIDLFLPRPTPDAIKKYFNEQIQKTFDNYISNVQGDPHHWNNLYLNGIERFFNNIRDVHRFLNSIQFTLGQVTNKGVLEVNDADFIAIETLRVFQPAVYQAVQTEKESLTSIKGPDWRSRIDGDSKEAQLLKRLLQKVNGPLTDASKEILCELFPNIRESAGLSESFMESNDRLRIHSSNYFDRYFRLSIPSGEISEGEAFTISNMRGEEKFQEAFDSLKTRGVFFDGIHRLRKVAAHVQYREIANLAVAAINTMEKQLPEIDRLSGLDDGVVILILDLVKIHQDSKLRYKVLSEIIGRTNSLFLATDLVHFAGPSEEDNRYGREPALSGDEFESLKKDICKKLYSAALEKSIFSKSMRDGRLDYVLYRWLEWSNDIPSDWYVPALTDPLLLEFLLEGFIGGTWSTGIDGSVKNPVTSRSRSLQLKDLSKFSDIEKISIAVEKFRNDLKHDTIICFDSAYKQWNIPNKDAQTDDHGKAKLS